MYIVRIINAKTFFNRNNSSHFINIGFIRGKADIIAVSRYNITNYYNLCFCNNNTLYIRHKFKYSIYLIKTDHIPNLKSKDVLISDHIKKISKSIRCATGDCAGRCWKFSKSNITGM